MLNKYFLMVKKPVEEVLLAKGFKVLNQADYNVVFVDEEQGAAYLLEYLEDKKKFNFFVGTVGEDSALGGWQSVASWLFDLEFDGEKQIKEIAQDFVESLTEKEVKKQGFVPKKNNDDGNGLLFFINRLASLYPGLKDDIKLAKEHGEIKYLSFIKEKVLPQVIRTFDKSHKDPLFKKLCNLLSNNYSSGDLDVRSVITIVILNSIEDAAAREKIYKEITEELKKAATAALKYKGKIVKPEVRTLKKGFLARTLEASERAGRS